MALSKTLAFSTGQPHYRRAKAAPCTANLLIQDTIIQQAVLVNTKCHKLTKRTIRKWHSQVKCSRPRSTNSNRLRLNIIKLAR